MDQQHEKTAASNRSLELVAAAVLFGLGLLMITDSLRVGAGWAEDGPRAGYFPFYIGLILCGACVVNVVQAMRDPKTKETAFLTRFQLRMVLSLVVPTTVFVIAVPPLGLYVSAVALIGWFMKRLGDFGWVKTILISIGVPFCLFMMFEIWFKVPLPKGPIEQMLGFS